MLFKPLCLFGHSCDLDNGQGGAVWAADEEAVERFTELPEKDLWGWGLWREGSGWGILGRKLSGSPLASRSMSVVLDQGTQNKRRKGCKSSQGTGWQWWWPTSWNDVTFTNPDYFHEENVAPPGHAAVDGKVDRIGEADKRVDDQHNVLRHLVVQKRVEAERDQWLVKF